MSLSSTGGEAEEEKDESFSPNTKMRIARLLKKQGDTKEALRLHYEVMKTEAAECGSGTLTSKERIAHLHHQQGDVKEALQLRCDILLTAMKELQDEQNDTLTTRKQISKRCARLRPVSDSLSMIHNLVQKFRKLSVNNKGDVLRLMQEIGRKLLNKKWRPKAFETIANSAGIFSCRDARTITTLCVADILPDKNMPMEALLGYVDVYKELGRCHFLATYITCAIVKCVVAIVDPLAGNRPIEIADSSSDSEVVSLTDKCCGLIIGLFSMVDMNNQDRFWARWEKFDDCRVECLRILETIPSPLPEPEPEQKEEDLVVESLPEPQHLTELDSAPEDVFPESEPSKELELQVDTTHLEDAEVSKTSQIETTDDSTCDQECDSKVSTNGDKIESSDNHFVKLQSENEILMEKLMKMQALLDMKTRESFLLSGENDNLRQQIEILQSTQDLSIPHLEKDVKSVNVVEKSVISAENNTESENNAGPDENDNVPINVDTTNASDNLKSDGDGDVKSSENDVTFVEDEEGYEKEIVKSAEDKDKPAGGKFKRLFRKSSKDKTKSQSDEQTPESVRKQEKIAEKIAELDESTKDLTKPYEKETKSVNVDERNTPSAESNNESESKDDPAKNDSIPTDSIPSENVTTASDNWESDEDNNVKSSENDVTSVDNDEAVKSAENKDKPGKFKRLFRRSSKDKTKSQSDDQTAESVEKQETIAEKIDELNESTSDQIKSNINLPEVTESKETTDEKTITSNAINEKPRESEIQGPDESNVTSVGTVVKSDKEDATSTEDNAKPAGKKVKKLFKKSSKEKTKTQSDEKAANFVEIQEAESIGKPAEEIKDNANIQIIESNETISEETPNLDSEVPKENDIQESDETAKSAEDNVKPTGKKVKNLFKKSSKDKAKTQSDEKAADFVEKQETESIGKPAEEVNDNVNTQLIESNETASEETHNLNLELPKENDIQASEETAKSAEGNVKPAGKKVKNLFKKSSKDKAKIQPDEKAADSVEKTESESIGKPAEEVKDNVNTQLIESSERASEETHNLDLELPKENDIQASEETAKSTEDKPTGKKVKNLFKKSSKDKAKIQPDEKTTDSVEKTESESIGKPAEEVKDNVNTQLIESNETASEEKLDVSSEVPKENEVHPPDETAKSTEDNVRPTGKKVKGLFKKSSKDKAKAQTDGENAESVKHDDKPLENDTTSVENSDTHDEDLKAPAKSDAEQTKDDAKSQVLKSDETHKEKNVTFEEEETRHDESIVRSSENEVNPAGDKEESLSKKFANEKVESEPNENDAKSAESNDKSLDDDVKLRKGSVQSLKSKFEPKPKEKPRPKPKPKRQLVEEVVEEVLQEPEHLTQLDSAPDELLPEPEVLSELESAREMAYLQSLEDPKVSVAPDKIDGKPDESKMHTTNENNVNDTKNGITHSKKDVQDNFKSIKENGHDSKLAKNNVDSAEDDGKTKQKCACVIQ